MDRLEALSIEVRKLSTKPFVITTWYRPPNSSVDLFSHLDLFLRKLDTENIEHYLMGDINCDLLSESNANANALLSISYGKKCSSHAHKTGSWFLLGVFFQNFRQGLPSFHYVNSPLPPGGFSHAS